MPATSLLNLPAEILDLIIDQLPPSLESPPPLRPLCETTDLVKFLKLRLVSRLFDHLCSASIIHDTELCEISEKWPIDSLVWLFKAKALKFQHTPSPKNNILAYLCNAAVALQKLLPGSHMEGLIGTVCKPFLLWTSFSDVEKRFAGKIETITGISPSDLLPLLALTGDIDLVKGILKTNKEIPIDTASDIFGTALYIAAAAGQAQMVSFLISQGADVNQPGGRFHSPLTASVSYRNSTDVLSLLLDAGADINAQGGWNRTTALIEAAAAGHSDCVAILLAHPRINVHLEENRLDESCIHHLCRSADPANLKTLLRKFCGVSANSMAFMGTPLQLALDRPHWKFTDVHDQVVRLLLAHEADVTIKGLCGDAVDWATRIQDDAEDAGVDIPAAAQRVLRWDEKRRESLGFPPRPKPLRIRGENGVMIETTTS